MDRLSQRRDLKNRNAKKMCLGFKGVDQPPFLLLNKHNQKTE